MTAAGEGGGCVGAVQFRKVPLALDAEQGAAFEAVYDVVVDGAVLGRVARRRSTASRSSTRGASGALQARPWRALLLQETEWVALDGWHVSRIDAYVSLREAPGAAA